MNVWIGPSSPVRQVWTGPGCDDVQFVLLMAPFSGRSTAPPPTPALFPSGRNGQTVMESPVAPVRDGFTPGWQTRSNEVKTLMS